MLKGSPARRAETRSVPVRPEEVSAAGRRGATRRSGSTDSRPTSQATIPSLLVSFHCYPPAGKKKNGPLLQIISVFSPQGWRSPICVGSNISGESEEYQTPLVDVDSWTVDMEKIVNLSVSVLLVLWGCALGGSPSVQIGRYPLVQTLKKKTRIG